MQSGKPCSLKVALWFEKKNAILLWVVDWSWIDRRGLRPSGPQGREHSGVPFGLHRVPQTRSESLKKSPVDPSIL